VIRPSLVSSALPLCFSERETVTRGCVSHRPVPIATGAVRVLMQTLRQSWATTSVPAVHCLINGAHPRSTHLPCHAPNCPQNYRASVTTSSRCWCTRGSSACATRRRRCPSSASSPPLAGGLSGGGAGVSNQGVRDEDEAEGGQRAHAGLCGSSHGLPAGEAGGIEKEAHRPRAGEHQTSTGGEEAEERPGNATKVKV